MITEAFRASVRPVPARQASASSNQAISRGMIGIPLIGRRPAQGCRRRAALKPQAQRDSPARQSSPGNSGPGESPQAASTMSLTSSSFEDTCRYKDIGAVSSNAATRPMDTASRPSLSATRTPASTIRARLRAGFGPFCVRSRTPQAAATVAGSSASAAPGPAITCSFRPTKLTLS